MNTSPSQRAVAPDIIRCFALLTVVGVHFFLHTGYYGIPVDGIHMFTVVFLRSIFIVCVPMFLLLTGYLMRTKQLSIGYFPRIWKTLSIYLLASVVCLVYKALFQREDFSILSEAYGIFAFTTAPYSWYIEMYIGLFLLIPFLNILYNNLPSQKYEKLLILVMLCLTAFPLVINIYRVFEPQWWLEPTSSAVYYSLVPDWWTSIYPLTYYFIGCYLSKHPLKLKSSVNLLLIFLVTLLFAAFNYYRSHNSIFVGGPWQDYGSAFIVAESVLIFNFFLQLDYSRLGKRARAFLAKLSDWCLGAYLVSWVFDEAAYTLLCERVPEAQDRLVYIILIVPTVYVCSLACSAVINKLNSLLQKCLRMLFPRRTKAAG